MIDLITSRIMNKRYPDSVKMYPSYDEESCKILYDMILEIKPKVIIELGAGATTIVMSSAIKEIGQGHIISFSIRHTEPLSDVQTLIAGPIESNYKDAAPPIDTWDLFFIDGSHTKEQAEWYTKEIFPKLRSGCVVHIHDWEIGKENTILSQGEDVVMNNFIKNNNDFCIIKSYNCAVWMKKL